MRYLIVAVFFFCTASCGVTTVLPLEKYQYDLITEFTWEPGVIDSSRLPFIVVDGKLFEFITRKHTRGNTVYDTISVGDSKMDGEPTIKMAVPSNDKELQWTDTTFVKVIDIKTNRFVLIDRFSIDAAVVRSGNYDTSSLGTRMLNNTTQLGSVFNAATIRDTVINGVALLYSNTTTYHDILKDSIVTTTFGTMDTSLVTPFSVIKCDGLAQQIVGYYGRTKDKKFVMSQSVGNIQKISDANAAVCKAILKKIGW